MNLKLILAYDGTRYLGWQKTKLGPSIEETLERALAQILQEPIFLQAASRTDRGVHAEGQVVNFITLKDALDIKKLHKSLNGLLPKDISVLSIEQALDSFHPTLNAKGKEYHYHLCLQPIQLPHNRYYSWHLRYPVNTPLMQKGAEIFLGSHDFSAFCNERSQQDSDRVRTLSHLELISVSEGRLKCILIGDSFLYKMVRNLVGTLVYLGYGKLSLDSLPKILSERDRRQAGITAPAHGLVLKRVIY
jgi:tRNA pseudouridine38-40 synthase